MAKPTVQLVMTGSDQGAGPMVENLIKQNQKLTETVEKLSGKLKDKENAGRSAFDTLSRGATALIASVGASTAGLQLLVDALEKAEKKAEAIARTAERARGTSANYTAELPSVLGPNASAADLRTLDERLRSIASRTALGDNALTTLAGAAKTIGRGELGLPGMLNAVEATAQLVQLQPQTSGADVARGVSSLMESGYGPQSAANMILSMGGPITDLGARGRLIDELQPFAKDAGLSMREVLGLSGFVSGAVSDDSGGQTATIIKQMYKNLVADPSKVEKALGQPLSGSLIDRISTLQEMNAANLPGETDIGVPKGPEGRLAMRMLASPDGAKALASAITQVVSSGSENLPAEALGNAMKNIAGFSQNFGVRLQESQLAADRAGRSDLITMATGEKLMLNEMQQQGATDDAMRFASKLYRSGMRGGGSLTNEIQRGIFASGTADLPGGGMAEKAIALSDALLGPRANPIMNPAIGETANISSGTDAIVKELQRQTDLMNRENTRAPTRPLPSAPVTSN